MNVSGSSEDEEDMEAIEMEEEEKAETKAPISSKVSVGSASLKNAYTLPIPTGVPPWPGTRGGGGGGASA